MAKSKRRPPTPIAEPMPKPAGATVGIILLSFAAGSLSTVFFLNLTRPAPAPSPTSAPPASVTAAPVATTGAQAVALGNSNYDRQNWAEAIRYYNEALRLGMDNPDVRTDLGNCYRFTGRYQEALEQYEISQRVQPLHEQSLYNMATLYAQLLNQPVQAARYFNLFLERFPQSRSVENVKMFLGQLQSIPSSTSAPTAKPPPETPQSSHPAPGIEDWLKKQEKQPAQN